MAKPRFIPVRAEGRQSRESWRKAKPGTLTVPQLAARAKPHLPDAKARVSELIGRHKDELSVRRYHRPTSRTIRENLTSVLGVFGPRALARTIDFFHSNSLPALDSHEVHSVARAFHQGREDSLRDALDFANAQDLDERHFGHVVDEVAQSGVGGLKRVMGLAPGQPANARQTFVELAALVSAKRVEALDRALREEGVSDATRATFVEHCLFWAGVGLYDPHETGQSSEDAPSSARGREYALPGFEDAQHRVLTAIRLSKRAGVDPDAFAPDVVRALKEPWNSPWGTKREILAVLRLAKAHGVPQFQPHSSDFRYALEMYRQPDARPAVVEAFRQKWPGMLSWTRAAAMIDVGLATVVAGPDAVGKALDDSVLSQARARTEERMAKNYARHGLFGQDRVLVSTLAENPLFVPMAKGMGGEGTRSHASLMDRAYRAFGRDEVRSALSFAPSGTEPEFALALLRTRNPQHLKRILASVPSDARLSAVRAINHYGVASLQKARGIVESIGLDPSRSLLAVAAGLNAKGGHIERVQAPRFLGPLTPEHERQLAYYYQQPVAWQRRVSDAVQRHRVIFHFTVQQMR